MAGHVDWQVKSGWSASFPGAATKKFGAVSTAFAANPLKRGKSGCPKSSFSARLPFFGHTISRHIDKNDNCSLTAGHFHYAQVRAALDPTPHSLGRGSSQSASTHPAADGPLRSQMTSPTPAPSMAPALPTAFGPSAALSLIPQTDTTKSPFASISAGNVGMGAENRAAGPGSPHIPCISPAVFQGRISSHPSWLYACTSPSEPSLPLLDTWGSIPARVLFDPDTPLLRRIL